MPIDFMFFRFSEDWHLLHDQTSQRLDQNLVFSIVGGGAKQADEYIAHNQDVTLVFQPLFKGSVNGDLFEDHGIHVNRKTGQIKIDSTLPLLRKSNFIIEATATNTGDGSKFAGVIRIQVHQSAVRIWLTPDLLTVRPTTTERPETTSYGFTVRAEFDDGVVGDITKNHGVTWSPSSNVSSGLFGGSLIITAGNNPGGPDIQITANWPGASVAPAKAKMRVEKAWSADPNIPKLQIVPGAGWPGTIAPERVPNILFLGDGFPAAAEFVAITDRLVENLKSNPWIHPFDFLATSMNFWRVFVPALKAGISVRNEVFTFTQDGKKFARALPAARKPVGAQTWTVGNLFYIVGLPVPADGAKSDQNIRDDWKNLFDPQLLAPDLELQATWNRLVNPTTPDEQLESDGLIEDWKSKANRTFIDEMDGFPGMSYGDPPAANQDDVFSLGLHPARAGFRLESFYSALMSANNVKLAGDRPIGLLWANEDPSFKLPNIVVYLSSIPGGRANSAIAMSTKTENMDFLVDPVVGRNAVQLAPFAIESSADLADSCRTLAHEIAHNFGLGDEYQETATSFADQTNELEGSANLQTEGSAKTAGEFSGDEIKWNWHRITRAALIEFNPDDPTKPPITETDGKFQIPVRLGQAAQFGKDDKLLLRVREWKKPLKKKPDTLLHNQELKVVEIKLYKPGVTAPPPMDRIIVEPVNGGAVTIDQLKRFKEGSIVYLPTPAPESVRSADYPYAEMVALNIKNFISPAPGRHGRPLTPVPCDNVVSIDRQFPQLEPLNLSKRYFPPMIIGLYEGGAKCTCQIYHPAGMCMMANNHVEHTEFCFVCNYIIVDFVNPFLHFEIDREYENQYPQT
jgi:hypothetical protein